MRSVLIISLCLLFAGCETQTLYDQDPPAVREMILDTEVTIVACNSHLFIPRQDLGPEAICIYLFTPEHAEELGVDLAASSIALNDEPAQPLLELLPENHLPSNSLLLTGQVRRGHIARQSVARDGIPKVIILFPANAVESDGELHELRSMGTSKVSLDLLFRLAGQQQRDQRRFTITSRRENYSVLDL